MTSKSRNHDILSTILNLCLCGSIPLLPCCQPLCFPTLQYDWMPVQSSTFSGQAKSICGCFLFHLDHGPRLMAFTLTHPSPLSQYTKVFSCLDTSPHFASIPFHPLPISLCPFLLFCIFTLRSRVSRFGRTLKAWFLGLGIFFH